MTALRILNVIAWGLLLAYMIPGAWGAARGRATRRGDPMRLGVSIVAMLFVAFNLRWLIASDNDAIWLSLSALSILAAGYIAYLARAYGRGPRL